jgi:hypothetical protein
MKSLVLHFKEFMKDSKIVGIAVHRSWPICWWNSECAFAPSIEITFDARKQQDFELLLDLDVKSAKLLFYKYQSIHTSIGIMGVQMEFILL